MLRVRQLFWRGLLSAATLVTTGCSDAPLPAEAALDTMPSLATATLPPPFDPIEVALYGSEIYPEEGASASITHTNFVFRAPWDGEGVGETYVGASMVYQGHNARHLITLQGYNRATGSLPCPGLLCMKRGGTESS